MLPFFSKWVLDFSFHEIILGKIPLFYFYVPKMKDTFLSLRLSWLKVVLNWTLKGSGVFFYTEFFFFSKYKNKEGLVETYSKSILS